MTTGMHAVAQQSWEGPSELMLSGAEIIAFDVDNTLVDILSTKRDAIDAAVQAMARYGLAVDPAKTADKLWAHALDRGIDEDDIVPTFLADVLGMEDERMAEFGQSMLERLEPGMVHLYPGVVSTLDTLRARGYRLYAVTDAPRDAVHRRLPGVGLSGRFDRIIVREDTPRGKADPRPFELLLEGAGADSEVLVSVGDHPVRDVSNVISIGGRGVLATHGVRSAFNDVEAEHPPTATIAQLSELLDLLPPLA